MRDFSTLLLLMALAGCVSVSGGGGARSLGAPERWLAFGPVEAVAGGAPYRVDEAGADMATDGRGRWVLVIGGARGGDKEILLSLSSDNGGSWSEPGPLHAYFLDDTLDDTAPRVATDGEGRWIVVWSAGREGERLPMALFSRSLDNGATWSVPARVNIAPTAPETAEREPVLATDGQDAWLCAWTDGASIVVAVTRDDGATWSPPATLYRGNVRGPAVTSDGLRSFTVGWTETYSAAGAPRRDRVLAVSSRDRGKTWGTAAVVADADALNLRLAYGANQRCLAVWESGRWVGEAWEPSGIASSASADLGQTWSAPAPVARPAPALAQRLVSVDTDGQGNWMAAWEARSYTENDTDVWASVSRDNGRTWSGPGVVYSDDPLDRAPDHAPVVRTNGRGRWIALWLRSAGQGPLTATGGEGDAVLYRINDLPRAWWRNFEVGVGVSGSVPL